MISTQPNKLAVLRRLLNPLLSQDPAALLIRETARRQWRLIAINFGSSLVEAVSEGGTLGLVYLAVNILSAPANTPINLARFPLFNLFLVI